MRVKRRYIPELDALVVARPNYYKSLKRCLRRRL